jgi:carbonic anhydrase
MNISRQNISGNCKLKCAYSFKYQESNCPITNTGFITIAYDKSSVSPVVFNNEKYDIFSIQINSPSLHNYNGSQTNAEIIINHASNSSSSFLSVVIPITNQNGIQSSASTIIQDIASAAANGAANHGESTQAKISNFTLNNIVPMKPFFTYSLMNNIVIVYGIENAILVNSQTTDIFSRIIKQQSGIPSGPELFMNPDGPNNNTNDGQIYIDCQPTGNSEENTDVENIKSAVNFDASDIFKNPLFLLLVSSVCFIILLLVFNYFVEYLSKEAPSSSVKKGGFLQQPNHY